MSARTVSGRPVTRATGDTDTCLLTRYGRPGDLFANNAIQGSGGG